MSVGESSLGRVWSKEREERVRRRFQLQGMVGQFVSSTQQGKITACSFPGKLQDQVDRRVKWGIIIQETKETKKE